MTLSLSTGSAILKTFYLPPLQRLFNKQTILWDRVERNDKWNPEGQNFTLALHYGRHPQAGSGRASSAATLPTAAGQSYANSIVPTAYIYTRVEIEGPIIEHARSNAGSFVRAVRSEIEGAAESTRKSLNRQANSDGYDALGYVVSGATTAYVVADYTALNHSVGFQPGVATQVDAIDASDQSVIASNITATLGADGTSGYALTLGTSETLTGGGFGLSDFFVMTGTLGYQMTGLRAIISANDPNAGTLAASQSGGGLQELAVATYPWWASQIVGTYTSAGMQDLRFPLLQQVISKVAKFSPNGKDDIKFILTSYAGQDKYYELASNERIAVNTMILDGGFEGVEFNGIPMVADPEHWDSIYDFIVPDALRINQVKDVDWMDKDGNVLFRVANADAYEATLFAYMNLGTPMRNSLGALVGINN